MCLILYAKEARFIKEEWIKNAHKTNDDGWGIVYNAAVGGYAYTKGVDKNPDEILSFLSDYNPQAPVVVHLRYTTKGKSTPEYAHPYSLTGELKQHGRNESLIMHNGTFNNTDLQWALLHGGFTLKEIDEFLEGLKNKDHSDTYLISLALSRLESKDAKGRLCRMLTRVNESRLLLLHHDAEEPRLYGKWHEVEGNGGNVYLSNLTYHSGGGRGYTSSYYGAGSTTYGNYYGIVLPTTAPYYPKYDAIARDYKVTHNGVTEVYRQWVDAYDRAKAIYKEVTSASKPPSNTVTNINTRKPVSAPKNGITIDLPGRCIYIEGIEEVADISIPVTVG